MGIEWPTRSAFDHALLSGSGTGIRIAILDSGVEASHPALLGRPLLHDYVIDLAAPDVCLPGNGTDPYGHGTAIASLIRAQAPDAGIGSFRVLDARLSARSAIVAAAAHRAIDLGYHLLHCSFGCSIAAHLPLYKAWTDRALLAAIHVVAASANVQPHTTSEWPAALTSVMAVRCVEASAEEGHAGEAWQVFPDSLATFGIAAPEFHVAWREGTYRRMVGSSFAAAVFTGKLARILSELPPQNPSLVKGMMMAGY